MWPEVSECETRWAGRVTRRSRLSGSIRRRKSHWPRARRPERWPASWDHGADHLPAGARDTGAFEWTPRSASRNSRRRTQRSNSSCRSRARQRHPPGSQLGKILGPARRLRAVEHVSQRLGVFERRACRVLGQPRSTQRYHVKICGEKVRRAAAIVELAKAYGRYGYRRITALLHREG